jgi:hypothetical protein
MSRLKHSRPGRRPFGARGARRGVDHGRSKPVRRAAPNCSLFRLLGSASAAGFMRAIGVAVVAATLALVSHNSLADEGGSSFWNPGSFASLAATPLQPGFSLTSIYYHPSVSAGKDVARAQRIRIGRYSELLLSAVDENTDTTKNQGMVTPTYTFATPVLGGQANVSMTAVYSNNTTTLYELFSNVVQGGPVASFSALNETTSDTVTAFGDLSPQVSLRWNAGVHNVMTYATGNIPVGQYNPSSLANIGIGHGALDGGVGYTYFDKAGREFSAVAGLTYNFIDPYTQYQNGIDFHLDWAASQFLAKQLQIGVVGYTYNQVTCDSGSGNKVGCFESRVASVGAQLGYTIPMGDIETNVNVRGYQEFAAANRPEGWNVWLTLTISPADSTSTATLTRRRRPMSQ